MVLALLQEGGIKSKGIMTLSFVELCPHADQYSSYYTLWHNHTIKFCSVTGGYFDLLVLSIEMPSNLNGKTPENAGFTSHYSTAKISGSREI